MVFKKSTYANNNSLAILMYEGDSMYGALTVNLGPNEGPYKQYIDVNKVYPKNIITDLEKEGKIKKTGDTRQSGFVTYPLYQFDKTWVDNLEVA